jgi:hypothetical protein
MTEPHQHHAQVIALDDYRRAREDNDEPQPLSFPQAAYPPRPPDIVTPIAAGGRRIGYRGVRHGA